MLHKFSIITVAAVLLCVGMACRRDQADSAVSTPTDDPKPSVEDLLIFPEEMQVADESVNEFVARAMTVCAAGRYEDFRLLWSARDQPLSRGEYEMGWQAVREIRIRALERVRLGPDSTRGGEDGEFVYVILAGVSLDPTQSAGGQEPNREAVLMAIREQDDWRLARAPKKMREWIRDRFKPGAGVSSVGTTDHQPDIDVPSTMTRPPKTGHGG